MSPIGQDRPSPGQAPDAIVAGVDVGSTTIKAVVLDPATRQILWSDYQRHETRQAERTLDLSCTSTRAASCVR